MVAVSKSSSTPAMTALTAGTAAGSFLWRRLVVVLLVVVGLRALVDAYAKQKMTLTNTAVTDDNDNNKTPPNDDPRRATVGTVRARAGPQPPIIFPGRREQEQQVAAAGNTRGNTIVPTANRSSRVVLGSQQVTSSALAPPSSSLATTSPRLTTTTTTTTTPPPPPKFDTCHEELAYFFHHIRERQVFSQNGEDGIIAALLGRFGSDEFKYYVEFGTEQVVPGRIGQINTRVLREQQGYQGLLMDGSWQNDAVNQHREFISHTNINQLFAKYQVPYEFNLLSIDLDYDDYFVWQAIDNAKYQPRVVITEFNSSLGPTVSRVANPKDSRRWTGTNYFGASFQAMKAMGASKGYTLVFGEKRGVNLFFVRTNLLECPTFQGLEDEFLYHKPGYGIPGRGHKPEPPSSTREYIENPDPLRYPDDTYPPAVRMPVRPTPAQRAPQ